MVDCPERKSLQDFKDLYLNKLQAKLCPDQQLPDFDPIAIAGTVFAGLGFMQEGNTHRLFQSKAFISEMCCDDLLAKAEEEGLTQRPATNASGCATITGNAGAVIPADLELTGSGNITYVIDSSASNPSVLDANGTATVCFVSSEPGTDANQLPSQVLQTLQSYPDIDGEVTLDETGFFGGSEQEDCESVRSRLITKRKGIQACGTKEWYVDRALEYAGVNRVCCASCECSSCGGCCQSGYLVMYALFDGYANGIAPQGVYDALTAYMFGSTAGNGSGIAPLGAAGEFQQPTALDTTVVIDADETPTPSQLSDITTAIANWYDSSLCVGDAYCPSDLVAVVKNAAPALCVKSVLITGTGVTNTPVDCPDTGQIPCGSLPILTSINFL